MITLICKKLNIIQLPTKMKIDEKTLLGFCPSPYGVHCYFSLQKEDSKETTSNDFSVAAAKEC